MSYKACRPRIVFNDSKGETINLLLENTDGTTEEYKVKYSLYSEEIYARTNYSVSAIEDYAITELEDCTYVTIENFSNNSGKKLRKDLKGIESSNVVLDLRYNYGGHIDYASDYVYSALFSDSYKLTSSFYLVESEENRKIIDLAEILLTFPRDTKNAPYKSLHDDFSEMKLRRRYRGRAKENKNVVVLTSSNTGSAADQFVSDMKNVGLVTVIGNNTGGEGLIRTFATQFLPNSKLVFVYSPYGAKNPDGTDNSVYGTVPDYYASQSMEDYRAYINAGCPQNLEEKLKYDTVFMYAYNLVKSEE